MLAQPWRTVQVARWLVLLPAVLAGTISPCVGCARRLPTLTQPSQKAAGAPAGRSDPPKDLRAFLERLRVEGEIVAVEAEVDPDLEVAEIHRRVIAAGGPALLFERVRGS